MNRMIRTMPRHRNIDNCKSKTALLSRLLARACLILTLILAGQIVDIPRAFAQSFDDAVMKEEIQKRIYEELESRINKQFDDMNAVSIEWGKNASFRAAVQLIGKSPKAVELFKKLRKEGKTPEQAFNLVLRSKEIKVGSYPKATELFKNARTEGKSPEEAFKAALRSKEINGSDKHEAMELFLSARAAGQAPERAFHTAFLPNTTNENAALGVLQAFDKFVNSDGIAVLRDLQDVATKAKSQLDAITKLAEQIEGAKDQDDFEDNKDTYIAAMKKFGFNGLDEFEVLEKRMTKIYNFTQNPLGKYSETFAIIQKGVQAENTGDRAVALFTLMEQSGSALPVLGSFIEMYAQVAKELLAATLRLRKAFSRWDMGCVGTGSYGFADGAMKKSFNFPGTLTACPDGKLKGLYEDLNKPDVLFFWDGKKWHEAPDGTGGFLAIHEIIAFLEKVKVTLPVAKSDVLSAFKYYGLPRGYKVSFAEAIEVHTGITRQWERQKQIMASFDIPPARIIKILEERTDIKPGFDAYLNNHFKQHQDLFIYGYLESLAGQAIRAAIHWETYDSLSNFRPKIILGELVLPDGLDLSKAGPSLKIISNSGVLIEKQSISLNDSSFRIVLFGELDSQIEYQVVLGAFVSNSLVVDKWKSQFTKHRAVFKASLEVDLTLPPRMEVGQKFAISGKITLDAQSSGTDFSLTWFVDGIVAGTKSLSGTDFSIPLEFAQAGNHDFEVAVVDGGGISGGERTDLPVAFLVNTELITEEDGKLTVKVEIVGGGGEYDVSWRTDTGITASKTVGRSRFFQRFEDGGANTINQIDLTVLDKSNRIEVTVPIELEGPIPVRVKLKAEPSVIDPGEKVKLSVTIFDGLPDYSLAFLVNGKEIGTRTTGKQTHQVELKLSEAGNYRIRVVVTDSEGETAEDLVAVTVSEPEIVEVEEEPAHDNTALEGSFQGTMTGMQIIDGEVYTKMRGGRLSFSISGNEVFGKVWGQVYFIDTVNDFQGKVTGTYYPDTGVILADINGTFSGSEGSDIIKARVTGTQNQNGFSGIWSSIFLDGEWEASK